MSIDRLEKLSVFTKIVQTAPWLRTNLSSLTFRNLNHILRWTVVPCRSIGRQLIPFWTLTSFKIVKLWRNIFQFVILHHSRVTYIRRVRESRVYVQN